MPGSASSQRIRPDRAPPTIPAMMEKIRYSVPMSLWLVEKNQRVKNGGTWLCASWSPWCAWSSWAA